MISCFLDAATKFLYPVPNIPPLKNIILFSNCHSVTLSRDHVQLCDLNFSSGECSLAWARIKKSVAWAPRANIAIA